MMMLELSACFSRTIYGSDVFGRIDIGLGSDGRWCIVILFFLQFRVMFHNV